MAGKEGIIISSITIEKLDNGCTVRVTRKIPEEKKDKGECCYGDGYRYETKNYVADDNLLEQVVGYVDPIVEGEVETGDDDKPRRVNADTFLKKK